VATQTDSAESARAAAELDALIPRYAGFLLRATATTADLSFIFLLEVLVFFFLGWDWLGESLEQSAWIVPTICLVGVPWLYESTLTAMPGAATWGKRWAGIYVARADGGRPTPAQALLRHPAKYLSLATAGIGFYVQPFTYRKQALHDLLAGTVVRER